MMRSRFAVATLFAIVAAWASTPMAQPPQTIDGYVKVSEVRVTRTVTRFTYRATLNNSGPALSGATASATSTHPSTTIVDGSLTFGPVGAGGSTPSTDTFSFDHDRTVAFNWTNISWAITPVYAPAATLLSATPNSGKQGQTLDVALVGDATTWNGTTTADFGTGVVVNSIAVTDATHATANITINLAAALGARTVTVTTGTEVVSLVNGFTVIDGIRPTVTINQAPGQADPTNGSLILFDVAFSEPVSGLAGGDINFAGSTVGGTLTAVVSGSGATYQVAVSGMTGSGLVIVNLPSAAAQDAAGNDSLPSTSTDNSVAFDGISPTVTINQAASQIDPTNSSPIVFDVVFSEAVSGFTGADVNLGGSTVGGTLVANVSGGGAVYTVSVTGMSGNGTVVASIPAGAAQDATGNVSSASTSTDNTVSFNSTAPSVTINQAAGQADPTNSAAVLFDVVFSESVTGFTAADVNFAGSTVGGTLVANVTGTGANYTVSVTGMTGVGTVVASIPAGVAQNAAANGNQASTSSDNTVTFDGVVPTVTIDQAIGQTDPTNATPIAFTVLFSEPVNGFDTGDISFAGSTVGGTLVANVSGGGASYTVSVSGMSGTGLVVASIAAGAASDGAGNVNAASTSTDNVVTFDGVAPSVTLNQAAGQLDPANSAPILFDVVFSEAVSGFNASDVSFAGSTVGGTLVANITGSGASYTLSVTGMSGSGSVVANIPAGAAQDAAGNTSAASTSTDNTVTFSSVQPSVTIDQAAGQADPTHTSPILFSVAFSESVTGFTGADISFAGSTVGGTLVADVTGSGANYTVSVTGMTGGGTVVASIPAGAAQNAAANGNQPSTSTDNSVTFDNVAPTVTINQAAAQADPTNSAPILFDVVFSEPVSGFAGTDVSFTGSTVGGTLAASIAGSGATYTVSVTGMSGTGTVVASVPTGAASDAAGNGNAVSTSTDNTVTFSSTAPSVTINQAPAQADPTNNSPILFDVVFSENVTGFTGGDVDFTGSTAAGSLVALVSGSGSVYSVSVSGMTSPGTVVASIPAGAAQNAALNGNQASTSTDNSVLFDNAGPYVQTFQNWGTPAPGTTDTFRFDFSEFIEPGTLTLADLTLTGPSGPIAPSSLSMLGDARSWQVQFPAQNVQGNYTLTIGPDVLDVVGNAMNQDHDGANGETPDDRFVGVFFLDRGPYVTSSAPSGSGAGPIDRFTINFNEPMSASSFQLNDIVSLTGPGGAIAATAVNNLSPTQFEVVFASQSTPGVYTLVIGPNITDAGGSAMDQDQDGDVADGASDRYTAAFQILPAGISSVSPGSAAQGATLDVNVTATNSHWDGTTTISFGTGISVNSLTVHTPTTLTANITVDPVTTLGGRTITITTGAEVITAGFSVTAGPAAVQSLTPNSGAQGETLNVAILGNNTHFSAGVSSAVFFGGGITVNSLTVTDATHATANITIAAGAALGARDVTVTTGGESASLASGFTVTPGTPDITSVTPNAGTQGQVNLDVLIQSQLTNFVNGSTTASFGDSITVNSVTVHSPTSATANITISPTAFAGYRNVTMTTGTETVIEFNGFYVNNGPAALQSLTPNSATQGDTIDVAIVGNNTHFVAGTTVANFGGDITVNSLTITDATHATANVTLHPFATPGARTIVLATNGEYAYAVNGFTVIAGTPRITNVSPASGQQGQTLDVTVTGQFTNFVNGTSTAEFGAGIVVNTVTVTNPTTAIVNVTIDPTTALGLRVVTINTGTENASSTGAANSRFNVTASAAAISALAPNHGRQSESLAVAITGSGTHFANGSTVANFGVGITVTSLIVNSPTSATANISIANSAALGARTVTMTTGGESAAAINGFTVEPGLPAIQSVNPATGHQAETLDVSLTAVHTSFQSGVTTASFGVGIVVNTLTIHSPTSATANITVDQSASPGSRTVSLTTGGEVASKVGGFTVTPGVPTLYSFSPTSAMQGDSFTLTLTGAFTNWAAGLSTVSISGGSIVIGTPTVNGPTSLSVPISIDDFASPGTRTVSVTTGTEVVAKFGFTVQPGEPRITSIFPNVGQQGLTTNIVIQSHHTTWSPGVTTASFGAGITVNSTTVSSATYLTANITIAAGATLGPRDVVVTTGPQVLTVPAGFSVTNVDTTAPGVLNVNPQANATDVPINMEFTIEFNEPMDPATFTTTGGFPTLFLTDTVTNQQVPGTVVLDAANRVMTFTPSELLAVNRTYYFTGSYPYGGAGSTLRLKDQAGNAFPYNYWYFTTGFTTDSTGPVLTHTNPMDADTDVPLNTDIELLFDTPINQATRSAGIQVTTGGTPVPGTWTFAINNRRLTFTPASNFAASTVYTVTLTSALLDFAGNSLANPGSFSFTTGTAVDNTGANITSYNPDANQTNVPLNVVTQVTFSELVNPIRVLTSTNVYIYNNTTNQYVPTTISVAPDRRSATVIPTEPLSPDHYYFLYFHTYSDIAGNNSNGVTAYFYTASAEDTTAPSVVSVSPVDGATGVPVNTDVVVRMSERIDNSSISNGTIQLTPATPGTLSVSPSDERILTFVPTSNLPPSTAFSVQVAGVRDTAGNTMAPFSSAFTTGASATADTTAPTVVSTVPAYNATNQPVNTAIVVNYSEPITGGLINSSSMPVFVDPVGSVTAYQIAGTYSLNAAGTQATFTPASPYPAGATVYFYINNNSTVKDLAGNNLGNQYVQFFATTTPADTGAPTVVMVTPGDGATNVGPNATVVVSFSESLNGATLSTDTIALFAGADELSTSITRSADNRMAMLTTNLPADSLITVVVTTGVEDLSGNPLATEFYSTFTTGSVANNTRPSVVTMRPGNGATGVAANTAVTLFLNHSMNPATVDSNTLFVDQNGVLVTGTISVTASGEAVSFTPDSPFAPGSLVRVHLSSGAEDIYGNAAFAFTGQFTVAADATTLAPTIVRTSPSMYASGQTASMMVDVEFSEPLNPATVTGANVYMRDAANNPVTGTVSLHNGDRVIRFDPAGALPAANPYIYLYLTNGLQDLQGVAFAGTNFYVYHTANVDNAAPVINHIAPPDGATGVGVNSTIRVAFSEPINPLTFNNSTVSVANGTSIPVTFSFNSTNTQAVITPQAPLPDNSGITVTLTGIEDLSGNGVSGTATFNTGAYGDTHAPIVSESSVFSGQEDVPVNSVFVLTFNEPMDAASVARQEDITLYSYNAGAFVPSTFSLSADGRTLVIAPDVPLAAGGYHYLQLHTALDWAGNTIQTFTAYFYAAFDDDATPPQVTMASVPAGTTNVPRNADVQLLFNEPVRPNSLMSANLLLNGSPVAVSRTLSNGNRTLTLTPSGLLAANGSYSISIAGVQDSSGNPMASPFISGFTTGSNTDLIAPVHVTVNPSNNDMSVGTNAVLRVAFSERVNPLALRTTTNGLRLYNNAAGRFEPGTIEVAPDLTSATFTPSVPLAPNGSYYFYTGTFSDLAGNSGSGPANLFFTGAGADTTPPVVAGLTPPNTTTLVPVNAKVVAVMSEVIDPTSLSGTSIQLSPAVAGTLTLGNDDRTLTFTPASNLAISTVYTVTISGLRDVTGNVMSPAVSTFTTGASATADTTAPTVTSTNPINGASGVSVTQTLTINMSERITAANVGPDSVRVFVNNTGTPIAGTYAVNAAGTEITFTPIGQYPANTLISYYTNLDSTIRDMAGNVHSNTFRTFTTGAGTDSTAPHVLAVSPADGATGVGLNPTVVLTLSESLLQSTINSNSFALFAGATELNTSVSRSSDNRTIFLTANPLPADTLITVVATGNAVDLSDNPLEDFASTFTTMSAFDASRPSVITQRPGNGAGGVDPATNIVLFLNQPVNPATVSGALHVVTGGEVVSGVTTVSANSQVITFVPDSPFNYGDLVYITLDDTAADASGNLVNPYNGQFSVSSDPAAGGPTVTRSSPTFYSSNNVLNSVFDIEFDEPLNPATVNGTTVFMREGNNTTAVPGTVSLRNGNRVVRFAPSSPLVYNAGTPYVYLHLTNGIQDPDGASYTGAQVYYYLQNATDGVAATSTIVPPNGATNVGVNAQLRVVFSEPINPLTVDNTTVTLNSGGAIPASFSYNGTNTQLTVTPLIALPPSASVTFTVNGVQDLAGQSAAINSSTFTTAPTLDTVVPSVVFQSLANGEPALPVNSVFEFTMSEAVDVTSLPTSNLLYDYSTGTYRPFTVSLSANGRTITIAPNAPLTASTQHQIALNSVRDLSGNTMGGISANFTTSSLADATAPQVSAINPADTLSNVPRNAKIQVRFDEPINGTTLDNIQVLVSGSPIPIAAKSLSNGNRTLAITLDSVMAANTTHVVSVAGVEDSAGNVMVGTVTSTFTTGTQVDLVTPANLVQATSFNPAHNATGVSTSVAPTVTFNEAINPVSVLSASTNTGVWLRRQAGSILIPVTYSFSADSKVVTLTPLSPLDAGTVYNVVVSSGISDLAGNTYPTTTQISFTTTP